MSVTHDVAKACALRLIRGQHYVEADHRMILDYIEQQRAHECEKAMIYASKKRRPQRRVVDEKV